MVIQNDMRAEIKEAGTDVLIRLHARLEVRTRDNLCGTVLAEMDGGCVGSVRKSGRGWTR